MPCEQGIGRGRPGTLRTITTMDTSITARPPAQPELSEKERLLAWYPSTRHLNITMTRTPEKGAEDKRFSSQIAAHGYDLAHKTMRIEFKHGSSQYDYHHVEPEKAASIAECDSFGRWVEKNLKGVHHYERVRDPNYYR